MARCPFAKWMPIPENSTAPKIRPTQVILHSAVDAPGRTSLFRFFRRKDVTVESHFHILNDGTIEQYMDTERRADANRTANVRAISIETEDDGKPDKKPWTPEQVASLVKLGEWLSKTHGIPAVICPRHDAPGFGYHSLFGAPGPWTPARGKTCPGKARIPQVRGIVQAIKKGPTCASEPLPKGDRHLGLANPPMTGQDVKNVQNALVKALCLAPADVDGVYGRKTADAVHAFQQNERIRERGVGPATWAALRKVAHGQ